MPSSNFRPPRAREREPWRLRKCRKSTPSGAANPNRSVLVVDVEAGVEASHEGGFAVVIAVDRIGRADAIQVPEPADVYTGADEHGRAAKLLELVRVAGGEQKARLGRELGISRGTVYQYLKVEA